MIVLPTFEYNLWESFWEKRSFILGIIFFGGGVLKVIVVLQIVESCCLASRFCCFRRRSFHVSCYGKMDDNGPFMDELIGLLPIKNHVFQYQTATATYRESYS